MLGFHILKLIVFHRKNSIKEMSTQNPRKNEPLVSLSQVITSQEIPNTFIEGQYAKELREEMNKTPILPPSLPVVVKKSPPVLWCVDCDGKCRMMSRRWKHRNGVPSSDDDDLYDWKGNQVVFPQSDGSYHVIGRRTQPGFS